MILLTSSLKRTAAAGTPAWPRRQEEMPVPFQNMVKEKFDVGMTDDAHGGRRPVSDILAMNEVVEEFLL
ncbi:MAG TPA: hypothetical protein DDY32_03420, partial [Desulfobulbaceae bacterium]|nr:hypothetical protein [Desulfobulbaceae bacterium]